ncbi:MAG: glycosyltransferase [Syntrophobacteraceae bacterium]
MRVAIFLPSLRGGGAERVVVELCETLIEHGYSVDLVLMIAVGEYLKEVHNSVRIVDLECSRLWTSVPSLVRYLRRERPEAVLALMPLANGVAAWARRLAQVPLQLVLSEHNARSLVFGDVDKRRHKPLEYLIRLSYRWADAIVAVSEGVAHELKRLPGIDPNRVKVILNPVNSAMIEDLKTQPTFHPWLDEDHIPVVLGVGRLNKQKDFPTLIRAFDLVRKRQSARLIILGEDVERDELDRLISDLDLSHLVSLPGFVANPFAYMARAKVFALSSVHEGLPLVLVEAMACGTPVVSTDCPSGPREILGSGRWGKLVPVGDVVALAEGILKVLEDPTPPALLKSRAKDFGVEAASKRYIEVLFPSANGNDRNSATGKAALNR